jgi:2,4-dienoyl-CoA reductase-like NADH-dependent reductase (Old Yellow Enzyme family)
LSVNPLAGLFTPIKLNSVTLSNRFVMPAMQRGHCHDGAPLAGLAEYYKRRVEGGVGLLIGESCAVDHASAAAQPSAGHLTPATVDAWARCVEAVHQAGGEMLLQLWHEGALRDPTDGQTLSPSGTAYPGHSGGRAASMGELDAIRSGFVRSAVLARSAGAPGVEVHACHGYLLDQFLWEATNQRTDGYGGADIRDRVRFPAEIVAAIRAECGKDFLISLRFSQWKQYAYEASIAPRPEDLDTMLTMLREAGVDVFHASTRRFWSPPWPPSSLSLAGWTRKLGGQPTIAVGSVGLDRDVMASFSIDADEAREDVLKSVAELSARFATGEFDLVAVGRSLIGDPDLVEKIRAGRYGEIRAFRRADIASLDWQRNPERVISEV